MTQNEPNVTFRAADESDADALAELRVLAMRDSLERVGRFEPQRARQRFLSGFSPQHTRHILAAGECAGCVVVRAQDDGLLLDHLYIDPRFQNRGIGAAVLRQVFAEADAASLPLRVGALRGSDSNRFYARHGFELVQEDEWDNYYVRPARRRERD